MCCLCREHVLSVGGIKLSSRVAVDIPIEQLQNMPVFGGLRKDSIEFLIQGCRCVERASGEAFFSEGERGDSAFVVISGKASLFKHGADNQRLQLIRSFNPGECFGAMALLGVYPRSGVVRAEEPCYAIEIKADQLFSLFQQDAEQYTLIFMNMARDLSRRLRDGDCQLAGCLDQLQSASLSD